MELLDKFLELLNEEIRLYESLLLTFQKEKKAVVDANLEELNENRQLRIQRGVASEQ